MDHFGEPFAAVFHRPLESLVIHIHEPEARAIPQCPFKVIHQRPVEVSLDRYAVLDGTLDLCDVVLQIADAAFVADAAVEVKPVGNRHAVFRDHQFAGGVVVLPNPHQDCIKLSKYRQTVDDDKLYKKVGEDQARYEAECRKNPQKYKGNYLLMGPVFENGAVAFPMATRKVWFQEGDGTPLVFEEANYDWKAVPFQQRLAKKTPRA